MLSSKLKCFFLFYKNSNFSFKDFKKNCWCDHHHALSMTHFQAAPSMGICRCLEAQCLLRKNQPARCAFKPIWSPHKYKNKIILNMLQVLKKLKTPRLVLRNNKIPLWVNTFLRILPSLMRLSSLKDVLKIQIKTFWKRRRRSSCFITCHFQMWPVLFNKQFWQGIKKTHTRMKHCILTIQMIYIYHLDGQYEDIVFKENPVLSVLKVIFAFVVLV